MECMSLEECDYCGRALPIAALFAMEDMLVCQECNVVPSLLWYYAYLTDGSSNE